MIVLDRQGTLGPMSQDQEIARAYATSGDMQPRIDDMNRVLCKAHASRTGELCRAPAMAGQMVCRLHGGGTQASKAKAKLRLAGLVDPAIATLAKEMVNADSSRDKQAAANSILDRAGWGRVTRVEAVDARQVLLDRLRELRDAAEDPLIPEPSADGTDLDLTDPEDDDA